MEGGVTEARYQDLGRDSCALLAFLGTDRRTDDRQTDGGRLRRGACPRAGAKTRGIRPKGDSAAVSAAVSAPQASASETSPPGVDLPVVTFEFNSSELTAQARQVLDQLSSALRSQDLAGSRILIEGHTDTVGGAEYNHGLSEQRAEAVGRYLASQQVDPSRLQMLGKGESEPLEVDGTAAVNRRVRVVNLGS